MKEEYIYHVLDVNEWKKVSDMETYNPSSLASEGFIHFSYPDQINGVIHRYYHDQNYLCVLKVGVNKLKSEIKYEQVPDFGIFPHVYGPLNLDSVVGVFEIVRYENDTIDWDESISI